LFYDRISIFRHTKLISASISKRANAGEYCRVGREHGSAENRAFRRIGRGLDQWKNGVFSSVARAYARAH
jgi:hypothetical protein